MTKSPAKLIIITFSILSLIIILSGRKHWERRCPDVCYSLGYIRWDIGKHSYFELSYKENVDDQITSQ